MRSHGRLMLLALIVCSIVGSPGSVSAQEVPPEPAFSNEMLVTYGVPEIEVVQRDDGYDAPREVAAGRYLVALTSMPGRSAYLNLVQTPAGLSAAEADGQLLSAAREDVPAAGWTYAGGTFAFGGGTAWVVLDLRPGEWAWGLTSQADGTDEEIVYFMPVTVSAGSTIASPVAAEIEPTVDVTMTEFAFEGVAGTTVPAGPAIWRFTNRGEQPHHMVLFRTPSLITQDDVTTLVDSFMSATPTPPPSWWMESVWVGYAAIMSPGQAIVTEFNLESGAYVALCFVADPDTGMPHLMAGMAESFTVGAAGTPSAATPSAG